MSKLAEAYQALAQLGWKPALGVTSKGLPYLAFTNDGEWLHVADDSSGGPRQSVEPYGDGRTASVVKHPFMAVMDLRADEKGPTHAPR